MNTQPQITLTRLDVQRLDKLLDPLKYPVDILERLENEIARSPM